MARKPRVLLAEDNPDHRLIVTRTLRGAPAPVRVWDGRAPAGAGMADDPDELSVVAAGDGEAALAYLFDTTPDLVLLDRRLPAVDALEILRRMRRDMRLSAVPVVVLAGTYDADDERLAYELGATEYVTKPPTADELRALVETLRRHWAEVARAPLVSVLAAS
jgi:CheY-like chemotaxis protein